MRKTLLATCDACSKQSANKKNNNDVLVSVRFVYDRLKRNDTATYGTDDRKEREKVRLLLYRDEKNA